MRVIPKQAGVFSLLLAALVFPLALPGQTPTPAPGKTIYRDSDGNLISNNEFVDIRMANYHIRDATLVNKLADGTTEFRLQKVPQEGALAPPISAKLLDRSRIDLAGLRGKVVVLNFWFVGCPPCRDEIPRLNQTAAKFSKNDEVEFVAITYDEAGPVKKYLATNPFNYKIAVDAGEELRAFGFRGYPKNIVIGRDGRIVYWRSSIKAWDKFESVISAELAKAGPTRAAAISQ